MAEHNLELKNNFAQNFPLLIALALIIILGLAVYANSLSGKFILDDFILVTENANIKDCAKIPRIFTQDIGAGAGPNYYFFRPLQILTYMLDYTFWKLDPRGYHLSNILLHILAAVSLFWLVNILFQDCLLSFFTSILFVVHPIHTEAVAYISGRADSLALLFLLLGVIFYIKNLKEKNLCFYILMLLTYIFALLSRESTLILPALLLLYHYTFKQHLKIKVVVPIFGLAFLYIIIRLTLLKDMPPAHSVTLWQRLPGFFVALTNYLQLLFIPTNLHMEYGAKLFQFNDLQAILGIAVLIALLGLILLSKKNNRFVFFSLSWFLLTLLPQSNLYPLNAYMAEHWLYIPSIGLFLLLAKLSCYLYREKNLRLLSGGFMVLLVSCYSYLTIKQNSVYWQEPILFYQRTLNFNPDSAKMCNNLANEYFSLGNYQEAICLYEKAIQLEPDYEDAYDNLVAINWWMGKEEEGIAVLKKAIETNPRDVKLYNNLATAYRYIGEPEKAIPLYMKSIALDPDFALAYNNLANTYSYLGQYKKAMPLYQKAIALEPKYGEAYYNLALAYFYQNQFKLAIEYCDKAANLGVQPSFLSQLLKPYRGK